MEEIAFDHVFEELTDPLIIDVRTPAEFEEDHVPGAINLPVLSNDARDVVGTIYHQESQFKARRIGAQKICRNVPGIIDAIEQRRRNEQPLLLYCWRGGLRSESLAIILKKIGYPVYRIKGGYKAYRHHVLEYFEDRNWNRRILTIYGLTGAGKTRLLKRLDKQEHPVLNLEEAAGHRGSVFGDVGKAPQPSQKTFESSLFHQLQMNETPIVTEGESRRIGRREIPGPLFDALRDPPRIWLETSMQQRVENIVRDYDIQAERSTLTNRLEQLTDRLGASTVQQLQKDLRNDHVRSVVRSLLEQYYDPAYRSSCPDPSEYTRVLDGNQPEQAVQQLTSMLEDF